MYQSCCRLPNRKEASLFVRRWYILKFVKKPVLKQHTCRSPRARLSSVVACDGQHATRAAHKVQRLNHATHVLE